MGGVFGGGDVNIPPPPGMSPEERQLLRQQTGLLGQQSDILSNATAQQTEMQNLIRELSGLYRRTETPIEVSVRPELVSKLSQLGKGTLSSMSGDPQIQALIDAGHGPGQRGEDILNDLLRTRPERLMEMGVATRKGGTSYELDQEALGSLKKRMSEQQSKQDEISGLQTDRYLKALKGELPVSQGTLQRKEKEFNLLREAAARRGNVIEGDSAEGGFGLSSAAAQNLGEFNRTYKLIEDAERRGELAAGGPGGGPAALGTLAGSFGYSPASLLPSYGGTAAGYGSAVQPFAQQRNLQYQGQLQNAALQMQGQGALAGLLGSGGGAALMGGHPILGASLIGAGYLQGR